MDETRLNWRIEVDRKVILELGFQYPVTREEAETAWGVGDAQVIGEEFLGETLIEVKD